MKIKELLGRLRHRPPLTKKHYICKLIAVLALLAAVGLDLLTKQIVVNQMALGEEIPLIDGVFHWKYIHNPGAAFGMLADNRAVFLIISTVAIIVMAIYLVFTRSKNLLWMAAIGMLVGGGIGNMIDRIALGYVIDFIYVALIDFAIFNVADCFVCIGVGLMLLITVKEMIQEAKLEKAKKLAAAKGEGSGEETAPPTETVEAPESPEKDSEARDE